MKEVLLLITTLFLVSCNDSSDQCYNNFQYYNEIQKPKTYYKNYSSKEIETIKTICPECKGIGKVKPSTSYKVGLAIASFGFGLLCTDEPIQCGTCKGEGYVEIPKID